MGKSFTSCGQFSGITQANSCGFPQVLAVTPLIQCSRTHVRQSGCSAYVLHTRSAKAVQEKLVEAQWSKHEPALYA